jgi:hypothetical protein
MHFAHSAVIFWSFFLFYLGADINVLKSGVSSAESCKLRIGQCFPDTMIVFDKSEGSSVKLVKKSKGYEKRTPC